MSIHDFKVILSPDLALWKKDMEEKAKNLPPTSNIVKRLKILNLLEEKLKDPTFRGPNDKELDRDLTGYRSMYIDVDGSHIDGKDGRNKPSHRLVYDEIPAYRNNVRIIVAFDTRDKIYDKAKAVIHKATTRSQEALKIITSMSEEMINDLPEEQKQKAKQYFAHKKAEFEKHPFVGQAYYEQNKAKLDTLTTNIKPKKDSELEFQ